jgi:hypothetical protein
VIFSFSSLIILLWVFSLLLVRLAKRFINHIYLFEELAFCFADFFV